MTEEARLPMVVTIPKIMARRKAKARKATKPLMIMTATLPSPRAVAATRICRPTATTY